jgi:hypothetical protein
MALQPRQTDCPRPVFRRNLLSLLLKFMSVEGCETVLDLANRIKLPRLVVHER